jgi:SSS family solute:Na+ symporter/sodium/proline symporter
MFIALILVPAVAYSLLEQPLQSTLNSVNPDMLSWIGAGSALGIISAMAWGLGYFGQPHIIVRFMSVRSVKDMPTARRIGMSWMIVAAIGAVGTGIFGAAYTYENNIVVDDPETIFLILSELLFHPLIAGFLLAAILAAIMSTISSQLLVSSSSLTEDFYKTFLRKEASDAELVLVGRISVSIVAILAIYLAYDRDSSILDLVSNAWAGFGAAFGPLVLFSLYWKRMNFAGALSGMVVGAVTVLLWIYGPFTIDGESLSSVMYEIVPGFILASIAIVVVSLATNEPNSDITTLFDEVEKEL